MSRSPPSDAITIAANLGFWARSQGQLDLALMEFAQAGPVPNADECSRQAREPRVQALFRGRIERAGSLVKDRKAGTVEQQPREGQTLLLAYLVKGHLHHVHQGNATTTEQWQPLDSGVEAVHG